ncbi:MAG: amidohydrolase family protein [Chitinophagaceae bacterium]
MQPIVDTHVHIWDLERAEYDWLKHDTSILKRSYSLNDLEPARNNTQVKAGVLVQAAGNEKDTALMLEAAAKHDWIKGVVAWLPLMQPDETARLLEEKYLREKYFKGVRHQIHDEPDARWLLQPAVIESLQLLASHNIPYDLVGIKPAHIETALEVAERVPGLRMVFDHLNQPPIAAKEKFGPWGELMKIAASHKNFYAKISGLGTASGNFTNWTADDIKPYIEFALNTFGVPRCFCGGDWPVSLLAGAYQQVWQAYGEVLSQLLNTEEKAQVFYTNAKDFYQLEI